ncbi:Zinc finger, C6HC-type [Artemisia annua]|uniref:RBR-type E3 ubiquitin transferase n=1 Tax=Artemisia annua TaxID=35608 RepID=A0A2U1MM38_ARTAN|nr:Zinc finger, C6HC-type [Artemisia annua]
MDSDNNSITEKSYVIIKQDELDKRQQEEIKKATSVLSISNDDACMLLLKYNWSATNVNEAWFDNEVKVRELIGLLDVDHDVKFPKNDENEVDCGICFDSVMVKDTANCGCGHVFCKVCWEGYVCTAINDGPGCLTIKCPEPSCGAAVGPDMVNVLAEGEERKKYEKFWLRSYVESNKKIKWCPGPGPLDCETVGKWVLKNTDESENTNWILVYTKPCPKCNRAIEKNHGCMMMTCRPPCRHRFCWLCLEPTHYGRSCNSYKKKIEHERKSANEAIKMYTHYYERWAANEKSRKQALLDLNKIKSAHLKTLIVRALEKWLSDRLIDEFGWQDNSARCKGRAGSSTKVKRKKEANGWLMR